MHDQRSFLSKRCTFGDRLPLVMPGEVFEAIHVILAIIASVPADLAIVWDEEGASVLELDGDFELFEDAGDDGVFGGFGVLDGDGVVVVEHQRRVAFGPDPEHGPVDDVGEGALGVVGDRFAKDRLVVASAPELALAAGEGDEGARAAQSCIYVLLPSEVGGEGLEVFGLEVFDDGEWELGLGRESVQACRP